MTSHNKVASATIKLISANNTPKFPFSACAATLAILVLLYFGLILRNWHTVEDIRATVVPFVTFGLFSGALLSVIPWTRVQIGWLRTIIVLFISVAVAVGAVGMHIELIYTVGFKAAPIDELTYREISENFYRLFALVSIGFFACSALCGFYTAIAVDELVVAKLSDGSLDKKTQNALVVQALTAIVASVGTILTSFLAGGAH